MTSVAADARRPIKYLLLVNKQGQTRVSQYWDYMTIEERAALEAEIVRKCLARSEAQCSFIEYRAHKVVYRRYASLFFIVGVAPDINELAILELIHSLVETLDSYFSSVCELDIMFSLEKAHQIIEEMIMDGHIVETNRANVLRPIRMLDKYSQKGK